VEWADHVRASKAQHVAHSKRKVAAATACLQDSPGSFSLMPKRIFYCHAIDYTNSAPQSGTLRKVLADVIARYYRLKGEKCFF